MIARVVSGGQTGVDIAALRAAKARGIPTGGTMPKGFRTLAGPKPEWAAEFSLVEHTSADYPPRTFKNVDDSDVTVRIAVDFDSAGERCTEMAIAQYGRPSFDIGVTAWSPSGKRCGRGNVVQCSVAEIAITGCIQRLKELSRQLRRPIIINFAGNSERTAPGIEIAAEQIVGRILDGCLS